MNPFQPLNTDSRFNLHGDRKSIDEAKRLIHRDGRCADLESIVRNLEAEIAPERKRCAEIERVDEVQEECSTEYA